MAAITTPEQAAELLASPMSPAELAELAHRDQLTVRGRPIPTEAGRWKAYLEQVHGLTVAEADAAMRAFHLELARQHHRGEVT
jgi:hypothetical protein